MPQDECVDREDSRRSKYDTEALVSSKLWEKSEREARIQKYSAYADNQEPIKFVDSKVVLRPDLLRIPCESQDDEEDDELD